VKGNWGVRFLVVDSKLGSSLGLDERYWEISRMDPLHTFVAILVGGTIHTSAGHRLSCSPGGKVGVLPQSLVVAGHRYSSVGHSIDFAGHQFDLLRNLFSSV